MLNFPNTKITIFFLFVSVVPDFINDPLGGVGGHFTIAVEVFGLVNDATTYLCQLFTMFKSNIKVRARNRADFGISFPMPDCKSY